MKQEVLITLRGTQTYGSDAPETVELMTRGTLMERNGKYSISYMETELTGTPGVTTTFFISNPQRVVLSRNGAIKSHMTFVEGVMDESLYDLGFGTLLVGICARSIEVDLTPSGGTLRIDYTVSVEQSTTSRNTYEIVITPIKETASCEEASEP